MSLFYRKSSTNYEITLYTTTYPDWEDELRVREGGTIKFAQLDSNLSHPNASHMRVRKDGTTYAVLHTRSEEDRGIFGGGYSGAATLNVIEYITISSTGNGADFGDLTVARYGLGSCSNGSTNRGLFGGGFIYPGSTFENTIDYVTINSTGNAINFGDLSVTRSHMASCSNGEGDRGLWAGGIVATYVQVNTIDYHTISSTGNAIDFGDITVTREMAASGTSNTTNQRGVFGGGAYITSPFTYTYYNVIDYVTINSASNASDFGNLTVTKNDNGASSSGTNERGVFGGGYYFSSGDHYLNSIDYVTINSLGNASDFGDLTVTRRTLGAVANTTRCVFGGGDFSGPIWYNTMDYITLASTGNASDFGDLTGTKNAIDGTTNSGGG